MTSLGEFDSGKTKYNASAQLASDFGDTVKRIDGTEAFLGGCRRMITYSRWVKSREKAAFLCQDIGTISSKPKPPQNQRLASIFMGQIELKPLVEKATVAAKKPRTMKAPRKAGADDLKMIKGVGPKLETMLNELGFYHFDQIAGWSAAEVAWVNDNLTGFKGRVSRDNWVEQARKLASGQETEFSKRVSD